MSVSKDKQKVETYLQKIRRGYKEQGFEGPWLNIKRIFIFKIKKYIYQKHIAPKNNSLRELAGFQTELRLIQARQLFLHSETKHNIGSNETEKDESH